MARLIEPRIARAVARRVAGVSPLAGSPLMERLQDDLASAVPRSEELVAQASGIPAPPPVAWGVIDRVEWVEANITGMTSLLAPLADRVGERLDALPMAVRMAQRGLVSAEVGALLGYVSRRVLGQYDLLVPEGASAGDELPSGASGGRRRRRAGGGAALLFVGTNIVETERRFGFVPAEFALWVSLHEVTHRFQFAGVPWLRARFFELVRAYLGSTDLEVGRLAARLRGGVRRLLQGSVPEGERNPIYLLASDEQRDLLNDIQALMAVVEGHGNFVMDSVGAEVIPSWARMRQVFERRREQTSSAQRAVNHVLGLEMKLRQYELGQRFCEGVVASQGRRALDRLWVRPDNLPTMRELREPSLWINRVVA